VITLEAKREQERVHAAVYAHCSRCSWGRSGEVYAEVMAAAQTHTVLCPWRPRPVSYVKQERVA
jgi:hypothetical protein